MRKFNLVSPQKNIRRTLTRDTPVTGASGPGIKIYALAAALFAALSLVWFAGLTLGRKHAAEEKTASAVSAAAQKIPPSFSGYPDKELVDVTLDDEPEETGLERHDISEPASPEPDAPVVEAADLVMSRPVAQSASPPVKTHDSKKLWYIRFGLCVIKGSCDEISAGLKKAGVETYVVRSMATIMTHRVIAGPWPTGAHADGAIEKMKQVRMSGAVFIANGKYYLSTEPFLNLNQAGLALAKIKSLGFRAERASKKERRDVYKVYQGGYKSRDKAAELVRAYKSREIACVLERSG